MRSFNLNYKIPKAGLFWIFCTCFCINVFSQSIHDDSTPHSTKTEALSFLDKQKELKQSKIWPFIKPAEFSKNLRENVLNPFTLYEGSFTNFCGYAAMSYLAFTYDPLSYVKFMTELYDKGTADYNKIHFNPSASIKSVAGTLRFKGKLDIRPADQLWFLSLADHFKGYINFFNKNYKQGAEDKLWAAVNFGKFNRMVKTLLRYNVEGKGSDLLHPGIPDLVTYINKRLTSGTLFLYLNNEFLYKKNENLKPGIPTHYIVLLSLVKESNGSLTMTYWDYGFRSLRQLSPAFLKRIVFGISLCTIK